MAAGAGVLVCDDERLGEAEGEARPSGTCSLRATFSACLVCPVEIVLTTSGRMSAHICSALMDPHSMILLLSHTSDTGFVKKSLHPAASAATRSLCKDEAVRATIMTEDLYGLVDIRESEDGASDGVRCPSDCGVEGYP